MSADVPRPPLEGGIDVTALLTLDDLGNDVFASRFSRPVLTDALYGGQVLGQSLAAATATVEGRSVHSLHGYFLRGGTDAVPVIFRVDRTREGGHFSTRRVVALQDEIPIFHMECSFRTEEPGYAHQATAPQVPPPEDLEDIEAIAAAGDPTLPPISDERGFRIGSIRVRPVAGKDVYLRTAETRRQIWLSVPGAAATDDPAMHRNILAYLSDCFLASTPLMPHTVPIPFTNPDLFIASIDHALWFHHPARTDDWLLYDLESPFAGGGSGLARGQIFDRAGRLIASSAQEALYRRRRPRSTRET
jgi:acyl-CoA thioesterase-2